MLKFVKNYPSSSRDVVWKYKQSTYRPTEDRQTNNGHQKIKKPTLHEPSVQVSINDTL